METKIDIDALLAPIMGDNPAGEDLRYSAVYMDIYEAMREEEPDPQESWPAEPKKADWNKVLILAVDALTNHTKDLTLGVWLTLALVKTKGFAGLSSGLKILTALLSTYWEHLHPEIEDGDLDYRAGPIDILNDKVSLSILEIPLTDITVTPGYSYIQWQESRMVGYESQNEYTSKHRQELIEEGKITAGEFDSAVLRTSSDFYETSLALLEDCLQDFRAFEEVIDEKFGNWAPRINELKNALQKCHNVVTRDCETIKFDDSYSEAGPTENNGKPDEYKIHSTPETLVPPKSIEPESGSEEKRFHSTEEVQESIWTEALEILGTKGVEDAIEHLFSASCSAPSERERFSYRLLMAKLGIRAHRYDLAKPLLEELVGLIEKHRLDRWESPEWIADIYDSLYQCLVLDTPSDEDMQRAKKLFERICVADPRKAALKKM